MRRREFITLIGAAAGLPLAARAQEAGRIYRLGRLQQTPLTAPFYVAFFDVLRQNGFVDGQNLLNDTRGYGLHDEQLAEHASELAKAQVDVIVVVGDEPLRAVQQATKTIPILANATDMVGSGFVASLAKPGGNITGVSFLSPELDGKRQEILIEAVPGVRRMAALADGRREKKPPLPVCANLTDEDKIRRGGDDGTTWIFRCGQAACSDFCEGRSAGDDRSGGAVRELPCRD
jgi:putative ABC transport system substrate-binding protein